MTQQPDQQGNINAKNSEFWDSLCGSTLAARLGIMDDSPASLKKFDDWYMDFYPYLYNHIPFEKMKDKKVLEIGLGYGTISEIMARAGADYTGLDIAKGPVDMVNHRLAQNALGGKAVQGSILQPPFEKEGFDFVVAIGCLHHTGNLAAAIEAVRSLLRQDGEAMIMVYSASSYRQFASAPLATWKRLQTPPTSLKDIGQTDGAKKARAAYDTDPDGAAAPQTEFVTKAELTLMCQHFKSCHITAENIGTRGFVPRRAVLPFGKYLGLDLYCHLVK